MTSFGEQLRRYRLRAGLSQENLATGAGLSVAAISALERGLRRRPHPDTVRRLAATLALTPAEQSNLMPGLDTPGDARRSNVPAARDALIGRDRDIEALRDLLLRPGPPLVTLTGVGGCGKTRVAQAVAMEVAGAFAGGACWVALAPVVDPALVPQAVMQALGMIESAEQPPLNSLTARLATEPPLIVLDNCEHLVDACAEFVEALLATCPTLRLLATSREPLGIAGEQQWRIKPLPVPDPDRSVSVEELERTPSVQLFAERCRSIEPQFRVTSENAAAVAAICSRLEGIPLALELAAARSRVLSPAQILGRLDDTFQLLTGGSRAAPTRQQTLRAALDWSHALLTQDEQTLLRLLAVFAGGFDLEAVEAVWGDLSPRPPPLAWKGEPRQMRDASASVAADKSQGWHPSDRSGTPSQARGGGRGERSDALDLLTSLVDKSLVQVEYADGVARYRLLEPVRQYACALLTAGGALDTARSRHAAHYLAFAERASPDLRGPEQITWLARLDRDLDNLRAALGWAEQRGDVDRLARLAVALLPFWEVRGYMSEGRRWLDPALNGTHAQSLSDGEQIRALLGDGQLAYWQADLDAASARFEQSRALAESLSDRWAVATSLTWRGAIHGRRDEFIEADRFLEAGLSAHESIGDRAGAAWALLNWGMAGGNYDDWGAATERLDRSVHHYRAAGDVRFIAIAAMVAGAVRTMTGDLGSAERLLREGLAGLRSVRDRAFMISGLLTLAWLQARLGDPALAARLLGAAEGLREATGASPTRTGQRSQDGTMSMIRSRLSDSALSGALAAGRAMTMDEAIEAALDAGPLPKSNTAAPPPSPIEALTRREREVVPLLARGATDREIAATLGIAVSTVGVHVHHILGKLGLASRWQVADSAVANGLSPVPTD